MSPPPTIDANAAALPPVVRAQSHAAIPPPRNWAATIAPAYLGVLAWFPLLDQLPAAAPTGAGVLARFASACLALFGCYALLYLPLAMLGLRTRRKLATIAAEAFGVDGSEWIAGILYGLFAAVWGSVAIAYSVRLTLDGLVIWGLLDADSLRSTSLGGLALEGPLVLVALAFWTFIISSASGLGLMGVITAMMKVYSPFAACLLIGAAFWCWLAPHAGMRPGVRGASLGLEPRTFQYVFAAFAFAGVLGVEWGGVVRDRRDVRLGGWMGILVPGAATCLAALALAASGPYGSIRAALVDGLGGAIGPRPAGGLLLLFGLASLAQACYAAPVFTERFRSHWPALSRWKGVGLSSLLLFLPGATGLAWRVESIATVSGAIFASLAGVLTGLAIRGQASPPLARGWRWPGVAAWGLGVLVGLAPVLGEIPGLVWLRTLQPASLFAYLTSGLVSLAASRFDSEGSPIDTRTMPLGESTS